MRDGQHSEPFARQPPQQIVGADLVLEVEIAGRLVEQQHLRLLRQCSGEYDALAFAAAQRSEVAIGKLPTVGGLHRAAHDLPVLRRFEQTVAVGRAAHVDDLLGGEGELEAYRLGDERHLLGELPFVPGGHLPAMKAAASLIRVEHARQHRHHRRLAGSVRADDRDQRRFAEREGEATQDLGLPETNAQVVEGVDLAHRLASLVWPASGWIISSNSRAALTTRGPGTTKASSATE